MEKISLDLSRASSFIGEEKLQPFLRKAKEVYSKMINKSALANEMLGWINLPKEKLNDPELIRILSTANEIRKKCQIFLVIGIGGSYLGSRAVIEALKPDFSNKLSSDSPEVLFLGNNMSSKYINGLLHKIKNQDVCVNVISKSGTTTEPAIAFRIIKNIMQEKYGKTESQKRIFITTDASKGALKELATTENYETFVIPEDVGGRYSIFTAVGLLPIAVAGIDIKELLLGAVFQMQEVNTNGENDSQLYAAIRNYFYTEGKKIEILASYEPSLFYLQEWWKQLFGESEGKNKRGIFPAGTLFTTDLHSLGQYIQEGERTLFETVLEISNPSADILVPVTDNNLDELGYLAGKSLSYINQKALEATAEAHMIGGVPNIKITLNKLDALNMGQLIYFFEKSCAISGYMLGVNPFNQPGVEAYKKKMFDLLGKPS